MHVTRIDTIADNEKLFCMMMIRECQYMEFEMISDKRIENKNQNTINNFKFTVDF